MGTMGLCNLRFRPAGGRVQPSLPSNGQVLPYSAGKLLGGDNPRLYAERLTRTRAFYERSTRVVGREIDDYSVQAAGIQRADEPAGRHHPWIVEIS
jgi:hypothetical protein